MATEFKLKNGSLMLSTEAPGGLYNSAQLKKIAGLVDSGSAVVKATEDQRLALFVSPDQADNVRSELEGVGLGIRNYQDGLHQPTACVGELCSEHQQDALGTALALSDKLSAIAVATPLRIGVNGCPRSCVPTHTLDISIIGEGNGYRVSLGGKNTQIPEMAAFMAEGIPPDELPDLIQRVVEVYKINAEPRETLQEAMERAGSVAFVEALAPYSQDAAGLDDDPFAGLAEESPSSGASPGDEINIDDLPSEDELEAAEAKGADDEASDDLEFSDDANLVDLGDDEVSDVNNDDPLAVEDLSAEAFAESLGSDDLAEGSFDELSTDAGTAMTSATDDFTTEDDTFDVDPQSVGSAGGLVDDLHLDEQALTEGVDLDPKAFGGAPGDMEVPIQGELAENQEELGFGDEPSDEPQLASGTDEDAADPFAEANLVEDHDLGMDDPEAGDGFEDGLNLGELAEEVDDLDSEEFSELDTDADLNVDLVAEADDDFGALDSSDDVIQDTDLDEVSLDQDGDLEEGLDDGLLEIDEIDDISAGMAEAAASTAMARSESELDDDDLQLDPNMEAMEVDEDAADAFEEKLNASIEEQETIGHGDQVNAADRLAAVELVASGAEVPEEADLDDALELDESSFDDLQIDVANLDFSQNIDADDADIAPEMNFSDAEAVSEDLTAHPREAHAVADSAGNGIAQVHSRADGTLQVHLSSGIELVFDTKQITREQSLEIDGMRLHVVNDTQGLRLQVNGMTLLVPKKAA